MRFSAVDEMGVRLIKPLAGWSGKAFWAYPKRHSRGTACRISCDRPHSYRPNNRYSRSDPNAAL
jgi:hypothetical protein